MKIALDTPMPSLNRRARQILPNIVVVDAVLPETAIAPTPRPNGLQAPVDQFRAFYERHHQREPKPPTLDALQRALPSASTE